MSILRKEQNFNVFRKYLKERKVDETRVIDAKDKLANAYVLKRFYMMLKPEKKNGELYTKASLVGIRFENCEILQLC